MKKFIALASFIALLGAVAPAAASSMHSINDAWAKIAYRLDLSFSGTNTNTAMIQNETTAVANSGENKNASDEFQSGTSITTGDTSAIAVVENTANEIAVTSNLNTAFGTDNDSMDSVNDATAIIKTHENATEAITNLNTVGALNALATVSNTGDNENSSFHEGLQNSGIKTGAADSATSITNMFNKITESFSRVIN